MSGLLRTTAFGNLVRLATKNKFLKYEEETSASLALRYASKTTDTQSALPLEQRSEKTLTSGGVFSPSSASKASDIEDLQDTPAKPPSLDKAELATGVADGNLVDWYGPQDPENPLNWSTPKKFFVTSQICLLTVAIYSGSSIYTPGIPSVSAIFGVSEVAAVLGLTLFVVGYGLGPMLWSPMSEVPYVGRTPVYIVTLAIFVALQAPTVKASSFGMLMVFRFLTGFFGSPVLATGGATCADMYAPKKRAYAISIWGIAAVCGPALGPIIGGYVAEYGKINGTFRAPWEWPIYTLMWMGAFCFLVLFFCLPETSASNILFRRTQRLRKVTGNKDLICQPEIAANGMSTSDILKMCFLHPFTMSFTEPMVFLLNLYIALIYSLLYTWFESFPIVFMGIHGFSLGQLGLAYLGILAGVVIIVPPFFWWIHKYLEPQFDDNGELFPEKRLPPCFIGAFFIPVCLFWFGWSSRPDVHWIMPIIGSSFFSMGSFLLFIAILNYLPDAYPNHIPAVLASNDLMRSSFGAAFPLFAGKFYHNLGNGWASSTLAFISIAFIPIPFVLYKYGPILRNKYSKIAKKDAGWVG